jgi:hypothetical protein
MQNGRLSDGRRQAAITQLGIPIFRSRHSLCSGNGRICLNKVQSFRQVGPYARGVVVLHTEAGRSTGTFP